MTHAARSLAIALAVAAAAPLAGCRKGSVGKRLWAPPPRPPLGYLEMKVAALAPTRGDAYVVVLGDEARERYLRVYVGGAEGRSLELRQQRRKYARPLTADLLDNVMHELGGELEKVHIDDLRDDTFIGTVFVRQGDRQIAIDARPSDAMALAVGNRAPIFVRSSVLAAAGVDRARAELEVGPIGPGY